MEELIGGLIVRLVPVALPICLVIALLVHWGILPDGTEGKQSKSSDEKEKPKRESGGSKEKGDE